MVNKELKAKGIRIGRNSLHNLCAREGILVKQRKRRRPATTDGNGHGLAPDYRTGYVPEKALKLWSTDITYIALKDGTFCYATMIVDEYSHLIVGYHISRRMQARDVAVAVEMAVRNHLKHTSKKKPGPILHSDRGSQFKSNLYINLLKEHHIIRSMTQNGDPQENPVSERLNGIVKCEFLDGMEFETLEELCLAAERSINIYNTRRPHSSISMLTPAEAHYGQHKELKRLWRKPMEKYSLPEFDSS